MTKEACYLEIMNRIEILFTPTKEERNRLSQRLFLLDENELNNLYRNYFPNISAACLIFSMLSTLNGHLVSHAPHRIHSPA